MSNTGPKCHLCPHQRLSLPQHPGLRALAQCGHTQAPHLHPEQNRWIRHIYRTAPTWCPLRRTT